MVTVSLELKVEVEPGELERVSDEEVVRYARRAIRSAPTSRLLDKAIMEFEDESKINVRY